MLSRLNAYKLSQVTLSVAVLVMVSLGPRQAAAQAQGQADAVSPPLDLGAARPVVTPKPAAKVSASQKVKPKPGAKPDPKAHPNAAAAAVSAGPPREKTLLESARVVAAPANVPDFVRESRPPEEKIDYLPLNAPVAEPSSTLLTRDQIKAREAELDSVRLHHDAISKRKPAPLATKSVAGESVQPKKFKLNGGK